MTMRSVNGGECFVFFSALVARIDEVETVADG